MNETSIQEASGNSSLSTVAENSLSAIILGWGLFWRFFCANAGTLFLIAGIICFFAFNWEDMSAFAKFGIIGICLVAVAVFSLFRGIHTTSGNLGLLVSGVLGGVLLAVYGQVYQTGANAWELFRAWTFFLIPLAIFGRQAGLWFVLWLVASLWGFLYLGQRVEAVGDGVFESLFLLFLILMQIAFFVIWEIAARFFAGQKCPFLYARWIPRIVGLALLGMLTLILAILIVDFHNSIRFPVAYIFLYFSLIIAGGFYYRKTRMDLFMTAIGLLSLIFLIMTFVGYHLRNINDTSVLLFLEILILIGSSVVSGIILVNCYRKWRPLIEEKEAQQASNALSWQPATPPRKKSVIPAGLSLPWVRLALQGSLPHEPKSAASPVSLQETNDDEPRENAENTLDPEAKSITHTPWQARALMGICAWIAVPLINSLIFSIFSVAFNTSGQFAILFLILLAGGIGLSYLRGIFFSQAALCMALTGALTAGVLIAIEIRSITYALFPLIIILAASYYPMRNNAYRFLAATIAITLLFFQLDMMIFFRDVKLFRHATPETIINTTPWLILFGFLYTACGIALAYFWNRFTVKGRLILQEKPLMAAFFTVPILLGCFLIFFHSGKLLNFLASETGLLGPTVKMVGIGAGLGLIWFAFQLTKELNLQTATRVVLTALCIPVAIVGWFLPWLAVGLFILALSRQARSIVLLGAAVFFLAMCTVFEYYALSTTLLMKALSLGIVGIVLIAIAWGLHQYLSWAIRQGYLSIPSVLVPMLPSHNTDEEISQENFSSTKDLFEKRFARPLIGLCILVFIFSFAYSVHQKEKLLENGQQVVFKLRPIDPRSLMQGDYMILRLDIENMISDSLYKLPDETDASKIMKGTFIAQPDEKGVYHFVRLDDDMPLEASQVRVIYRAKNKGHIVAVGSGSFFFQEGRGKDFDKARYVEMRVGENGETLITHLLDSNLQRIEPEKKEGTVSGKIDGN